MWTRCLLGLMLFYGSALAAPIVYVADLDGASEDTPNNSTGVGTAKVTLDAALHTMQVEITFSDLVSFTTNSHIHCCTATANSGIVGVATVTPTFTDFPSGVTSGTYSRTFDLLVATSFNGSFVAAQGSVAAAEAALFAGMAGEQAYVNIHTVSFGAGEIRGFLREAPAIPEPSTLLLSGGALLALAAFRRRRLQVR